MRIRMFDACFFFQVLITFFFAHLLINNSNRDHG